MGSAILMPTDNEGNDNLYISDMDGNPMNDKSLNTLLRKSSPKETKDEMVAAPQQQNKHFKGSFAPTPEHSEQQIKENQKQFRGPNHKPDIKIQYTPLNKSRKHSDSPDFNFYMT